MKTLFGSFLAVIAGIAVALVLVVGVEFFSSIVHRSPPTLMGIFPNMLSATQHGFWASLF